MREIKFRVYDKVKNKYNTWYNYDKNEPHELIEYFNHPAACFLNALKDTIKDDNFVIQQFTGLFDRNGKEIYEGDIIQYNYPKNEKNNKVLVRWTTEEYDNHPGFIIRDSFEQYGDYEVIGNIYENPDLL